MNNGKPTYLDLFSGIGGFAIAARWAGFKPVAFCEKEPFCRRNLKVRFPAIPCFPDIRSINGKWFRGVTLITGGFPCQPFSLAGKRRGTEDDRNLWPQMQRVIAEARPDWVLGENVVGIFDMELDRVLSDLEAIGYTARPFIIPACAVDARHKRERIWIVANANSDVDSRTQRGIIAQTNIMEAKGRPQHGASKQSRRTGAKEWAESQLGHALSANATGQRLQGIGAGGQQKPRSHERPPLSLRDCGNGAVWEAEPAICRVVDGIPHRMDRLRALGNAIVPQCAYPILRAIRALT